MFKVRGLATDEVNDQGVYVTTRPGDPVVNARLNVERSVTVQLSRVHFAHLIGGCARVSATVHGGEDQSLGVQDVTSELTGVAQLKDALSDFQGCPVHFIEEQQHRFVAGPVEPVRRAERSHVAVSLRQTQQVAFGHLAGAPLNDGQTNAVRELVDDTGLANAVPSAKQNGVICTRNVREDRKKGLEVYGHCLFAPGSGLLRRLSTL